MADYTMNNYYRQGQYEDAINFASEDEREHFSEWDYLFLSMCLFKLKKYSDFILLYKEFNKKYPSSDKLNNNLGWSLYHTYIKIFDFETGNRKQYLNQIDYILAHSDNSQYSPKRFIASLAADAVFKQKLAVNPDYELGNKYLSFIDPLSLDQDEKIIEVNGKTRKTLSAREQWYNRKTKALVELGRYEECILYIDAAFQNIDKGNFHNNINHWLNYRRALCYYGLENLDKAENTINEVLTQFEHWCFYCLLFDISVEKGDIDSAIRYGAICSLADREHKLRVSFYEKYAGFLLHHGYPEEAVLHYKLVEEIRTEESWREIRLPDEFSYPEDVLGLDKKAVIKELIPFWKQEKERGIEFYKGTIVKVLDGKNSGFIRREDNAESYYFNVRDFLSKVTELKENDKVRFTLVERFNKKKNEMSYNAVQISYIG